MRKVIFLDIDGVLNHLDGFWVVREGPRKREGSAGRDLHSIP